jgi:hypothetical protein
MFIALAATLLFAAPPVPVGPPTLCHPFDIGDARSLPWGSGPFDALADYDLQKLPKETYEILSRSDDPLVHGETLRRAVLYLTGTFTERGATPADVRDELIAALTQELEFDADVHAPVARAARESGKTGKACNKPCPGDVKHLWDPAPPLGGRVCQAQARDPALCFLDLGYLRAALREAGQPAKDDGSAALRDALRLKPDSAALRLTAALGMLDSPDAAKRAEAWQDVSAVAQADEQDEHLRRNLLATVGPILNAKNHDDLVARLHERLAKG